MNSGNGTEVRGRVKWFNRVKGYGFIVRDDAVSGQGDDADIFVHARNLPEGVRHLDDGQQVAFEIEHARQGLRAANLRLVGPYGEEHISSGSIYRAGDVQR